MLTGDQYRQSLADGRRVFFQGKEVDVLEHEIFQRSIRNVARTYDKYFNAEDGAISEYFRAPRSVEEMKAHAEHKVDVLTSNTYGSLMTLLTSADRIEAIRPEASAAMREYVAYVQREDLRIAECITDAKGDRSKSAAAQEDPDAYLRVVEQRPDGVVIRGAKLHISGAAISHELLVIPTKRMKEGEEAYSIACTVPVNAEGVKIVNVTSEPQGEANFLDAPISANAHTAMGFVIFDNVFVPGDRVFLNGEYRAAATFAHALGLWVRMNGLKNMADEADALVGFAQLIAEANGLERAPNIRDRITEMIMHATIVRACLDAALSRSTVSAEGVVVPDELYANAGKYQGAAFRALMISHIQDIAGGSLVTAPSSLDLENPEIGHEVRKYMSTMQSVDGKYRTSLFHALRDVVASGHAGQKQVATLQGGGGLSAQRIVTRGRYDLESAKRQALQLAGLDAPNA